jgi:hypothetical protein
MKQMSEALQSAQQSLQNAGQQTAQGQQGQKGQNESSEEEMGQEFGSSQQQSGQGQKSGQGKSGQQSGQSGQSGGRGGRGAGLGGPGQGVGGRVGPQQPLPGVKKDQLVRGNVNPRGEHMSRSYMGTPDPTKDRAAYYQVVPERVRAAEASLNREEIPAGHRDQVRRYFESISPGGK